MSTPQQLEAPSNGGDRGISHLAYDKEAQVVVSARISTSHEASLNHMDQDFRPTCNHSPSLHFIKVRRKLLIRGGVPG